MGIPKFPIEGGFMDELVTARQISERVGISKRRVNQLIKELSLIIIENRIPTTGGHPIPLYSLTQWEIQVSRRNDLLALKKVPDRVIKEMKHKFQEQIDEIKDKVGKRYKEDTKQSVLLKRVEKLEDEIWLQRNINEYWHQYLADVTDIWDQQNNNIRAGTSLDEAITKARML
jgi:predicted DNA-binding ArsR family transcriptional regulator